MNRAAEDHTVRITGGSLSGAALAQFLLNVQEYDQLAAKLARKLGDARVVELVAASDLEKKADFETKKALEKLEAAIERAKIKTETKIAWDEEHSLYELLVGSGTGIHKMSWPLASTPEYKRLHALHAIMKEYDRPPFTISTNGTKVAKETATEVLLHVLEAAKKDFAVTRFKGLGEMNPEQLWETTMNADTRTLLKVRLEDAVAADEIFTTVMGENVEQRRKFIEENALDVRNLDI